MWSPRLGDKYRLGTESSKANAFRSLGKARAVSVHLTSADLVE